MKSLVSRIWFPAAVAAVAAVHTVAFEPGVSADMSLSGISVPLVAERPDTVIYPVNGYKKGWSEEDFMMLLAQRVIIMTLTRVHACNVRAIVFRARMGVFV